MDPKTVCTTPEKTRLHFDLWLFDFNKYIFVGVIILALHQQEQEDDAGRKGRGGRGGGGRGGMVS